MRAWGRAALLWGKSKAAVHQEGARVLAKHSFRWRVFKKSITSLEAMDDQLFHTYLHQPSGTRLVRWLAQDAALDEAVDENPDAL